MTTIAHLKPPLKCPACKETLNRRHKHCDILGCNWLWCNNCKALVGPYSHKPNGTT